MHLPQPPNRQEHTEAPTTRAGSHSGSELLSVAGFRTTMRNKHRSAILEKAIFLTLTLSSCIKKAHTTEGERQTGRQGPRAVSRNQIGRSRDMAFRVLKRLDEIIYGYPKHETHKIRVVLFDSAVGGMGQLGRGSESLPLSDHAPPWWPHPSWNPSCFWPPLR